MLLISNLDTDFDPTIWDSVPGMINIHRNNV